jgi:hypothetical protein
MKLIRTLVKIMKAELAEWNAFGAAVGYRAPRVTGAARHDRR